MNIFGIGLPKMAIILVVEILVFPQLQNLHQIPDLSPSPRSLIFK